MRFIDMTGADHMAAAERAFNRDEARLQRSISHDPADDDYFFDDIDSPEDESLGEHIDAMIRAGADEAAA